MAIIKIKEIHTMERDELNKRLSEFRLELAKDRGQIAVGGSPANAGRMRQVKKTIARILTELNLKKRKVILKKTEKKKPMEAKK